MAGNWKLMRWEMLPLSEPTDAHSWAHHTSLFQEGSPEVPKGTGGNRRDPDPGGRAELCFQLCRRSNCAAVTFPAGAGLACTSSCTAKLPTKFAKLQIPWSYSRITNAEPPDRRPRTFNKHSIKEWNQYNYSQNLSSNSGVSKNTVGKPNPAHCLFL